MLMLLTIIKLLQSFIQPILHWLFVPSHLRRGYKFLHPANRHDHRHSPQKTEWIKPKIIRTDCGRDAEKQRGPHRRTLYGYNEAIFTSRIFRRGLKLLGIRHQLSDPGCPWQNGRIERLFGTLKQKLDQWQVPGIVQLNRDLKIFRYWYNHIRPHQNLDGKTPAEAWARINLYAKPPKQEQWFEAWDGLLMGYDLRR